MERVMNLNDVIVTTKNWSNCAHLLKKFLNDEIFFELDSKFEAFQNKTVVASENLEIRMQFVTVQNSNFSLFYTTKENFNLKKGSIGGVPLIAAIEMILKVPEVDGLLLQSDSNAWVAVKKQELENLLKSESSPISIISKLLKKFFTTK